MAPTLEDHFDKSAMPKVMQVRVECYSSSIIHSGLRIVRVAHSRGESLYSYVRIRALLSARTGEELRTRGPHEVDASGERGHVAPEDRRRRGGQLVRRRHLSGRVGAALHCCARRRHEAAVRPAHEPPAQVTRLPELFRVLCSTHALYCIIFELPHFCTRTCIRTNKHQSRFSYSLHLRVYCSSVMCVCVPLSSLFLCKNYDNN